MSTAYKCKSCGAPLRFDPHTGKLRCDHCDASFFPYEYYRSRSDKGTMSAAEVMQAEGAMQVEGEMQAEGVYQADGEKQTEGDIAIYQCPNCGAEILTADSAISDRCVYCGYPVEFVKTLTGEFIPDFILPFEKDTSDAVSGYQRVLKSAPFAPKEFREKSALERFRGVYVPVWLYTMDVEAKIDVRGRVNGKKMIGHTSYGPITQDGSEILTVHEEGTIHYEHIARDGLRELDDLIVRCLSPYDYWKRRAFDPSYLAGFYAQRWDVDFETCHREVCREVLKAAEWDIHEHACDIGDDYADRWKNTDNLSAREFTQARAKRWDNGGQMGSEKNFIRTSNRLDPDGGLKVLGNDVLPPDRGTGYEGRIVGERVEYALVPVWLMYTRYKDKDYMFAMNGQTGEIDGNMPTSVPRFLGYLGLTFLMVLGIFLLNAWLNAQPDTEAQILIAGILPVMWFLNLVRKQTGIKLTEKNAEPVTERMYRRHVHEEKKEI